MPDGFVLPRHKIDRRPPKYRKSLQINATEPYGLRSLVEAQISRIKR